RARRGSRMDGRAGEPFLLADRNAQAAPVGRRSLEVQSLSAAAGAGTAQRRPGVFTADARRLPRARPLRHLAIRELISFEAVYVQLAAVGLGDDRAVRGGEVRAPYARADIRRRA